MQNLYPPSAHDVYFQRQISFPAAVDAACEKIRHSTKGLGTDERTLIKTLSSFSPNDRILITLRYKQLYREELKDVLASETSGDFGFLLQLVAVSLPEAEAYIIDAATSGAGTTEKLLYPVLLGRTNTEMEILKKTYFDIFNQDLSVVVDSEVGGDYKTVLMAAVQGTRMEYNAELHTRKKAEEDAEALYNAGEGKWGTDEDAFVKVVLFSPPLHLQHVNDAYLKKYNKGIKVAIDKEFSGYARTALLFYMDLVLNYKEALANLFESTMKGFGTDEKGLSSALVRYHSFIPYFSKTYEKLFGQTLKDRIDGEVTGDYQDLLMALLDGPYSPTAP